MTSQDAEKHGDRHVSLVPRSLVPVPVFRLPRGHPWRQPACFASLRSLTFQTMEAMSATRLSNHMKPARNAIAVITIAVVDISETAECGSPRHQPMTTVSTLGKGTDSLSSSGPEVTCVTHRISTCGYPSTTPG